MPRSGQFAHRKYTDIMLPLTNAYVYARVYQPEALAQTKRSDYFRNPSKRPPLKFCTELLILTTVLGCWL